MKVKELSITANITWSPDHVKPIYIACGTSAQQLDASFSSSSVLQLYDLNSSNASLDMKLVAAKSVPAKFNKILWNGREGGIFGQFSGIIAGGCDDGSIYIYSADKLLQNEEPVLASMENKHTGPIYAMDFNHHQPNLLTTGSTNCEIIIWDINDPSSPMTPGTKPKVVADVNAVAWNRQVEHIMASTYAGRCVVYDLRKSASIIQIAESVSRIKAHSIKWHPAVATQLILGCNDDSSPYGQVWDLRFAAAPLKTLEGHQQGIMASAWCSADPDLFLTSAKDNKIYVWNPNNSDKLAEIVGEFPSYNQWSFDVSWCCRDPSLVAASSIDGTVSVYSVMGAGIPPVQNNKFSAIADSFPGMEVPVEVPQTVQPQSIYLKRPPKWLLKRCGASFGFGGRLVSWSASDRNVSVSQVVTEPDFVSRSVQLEEALSRTDLVSFCQSKAEISSKKHEKILWSFIGATFQPSIRNSYMTLLGFSSDQVAAKVRPQDLAISPEELANKISSLGRNGQDGSTSSLDPSEQFEMIASAHSTDKTPEIELESNFECIPAEPMSLAVGEDPHGMIRHALLVGDYESSIQLCLKEKKTSLALILAAHAGTELFTKTRDRVLKAEPHVGLSPLVTAVVQKDLHSFVSACTLDNWKESLVATFTYATDDELSALVEILGDRLEADGSQESLQSAVLCFLCAGSLDKFVSCLSKTKPNFLDGSPSSLQDLVEIMVMLERALSSVGRSVSLKEGSYASVYLCNYASLLASQGALSTAVSYLNNPTQGDMVDLRDRLYRALGYPTGSSLAARNRSISTSSQHSFRRPSTPLTYQPPQFTPSVQAQQAPYGTPQTSFYNPTPPQKQPPSFMQPTATVSPTFGAGIPPLPPSHFQLSPMTPFGPPPSAPPLSGTQPKSGGFRRSNTPSRYVQEDAVTPTGGSMFTSSPNPPHQSVQPNTHFPHFNPASATAMLSSAGPSPPPIGSSSSSFAPEEAPETFGNFITPAAFDPSVPRGWNDPPPLSASRRWDERQCGPSFMGEHSGAKRLQSLKAKQRQKSLSGTSGEGTGAPVPHVMVPEPTKQFSGFQQTFQGMLADVGIKGDIQRPNATIPTQASQPPPPKKGPLPVEHQIIQDVFNRLREKGLLSSINPTAKQRLEDLSLKIEILYDKLRQGTIGASTVDGLHQIVAAVKSGDYHRALQLHSSTISAGNFSEMSQFMPAVKMLLTTCMQCQIFYN